MSPRAFAAVAVLIAAAVAPASAQVPGSPPAPAGYARVGDAAPVPPNTFDNSAFNPGISGGSVVQIQNQPMASPADGAVGSQYSGLATEDFSYGGGARGLQTWVGVEYLLFWTRHAPLPVPLANVGPAASFGITGQNGVRTIVGGGGDEINFHTFSGVRVNAGWWFNENQSVGIEGSLFVLPTKSTGTPNLVAAPGLPTLARPFFDTALNRQNSRLLTRPNTFTGGFQTEATQMVWGAEVLPVLRWIDNGDLLTVDLMTGFKFLSVEESLTITDFAAAGPIGVANYNGQEYRTPATTYVQDRFATANRFYGATFGARTNLNYEAFTLGVTGKFAIGQVRQQVRVDGTTTLAGPFPTVQVTPSGFYATGANSGSFEQNKFAVLPEVGLNLAVQLTSHLTMTLGYSTMYISEVLRPGDQLSNSLNSTLIPTGQNYGARFGPQTPGLPFTSNSFWANGFNFGFAYGY